MRRQSLPADSPYSADIASRGLVYLARYNPVKALDYWEAYRDELAFSAEQVAAVEYAISLQGLFAKSDELKVWLHSALDRLEDDKLVQLRLRWALAEQDWPALEETLPLLSDELQEEGVWRYWKAIALEQRGEQDAAREILEALAGERDYYSFLAADKLGRPYAFNHQPLVLESAATQPLQKLPAVKRIGELHFHEEDTDARSEWFKMLYDTEDADRHQKLAKLAADEGWDQLAIDAANRAKAWDALDLRFPMLYQDTFQRYASAQQVPSTELMAIARRESTFFPQARSPVGARGLMQIMPATGKQVAKSIGRSHNGSDLYEVDHNVLLGSAYYRQLLDRFDGNRVFALTAYNAGPHRVDRWRHKAGEEVPVEIWVETIPYKETRNYVKAVLSYNVVFQYLMGDTRSLLTPEERAAAY
jgi:soluble lytic murein transglycosylase